MIYESYTFDAPALGNVRGLKISAKRYIGNPDCNGLTLVLAHGAGLHKEQWEPVLERIFSLDSSNDRTPGIREAWAFDWQTHGESAILNKALLRSNAVDHVSISDYALVFKGFLLSSRMHGHRIVFMGHSAGATTCMYLFKLFVPPSPPLVGCVLVEPPLIDKETFDEHIEDREKSLRMITRGLLRGRETWSSKQDALQWLRGRLPWKTWDARALNLYCEFGLAQTKDKVYTKCSKAYEARCFTDLEKTFEATEYIATACQAMPVHIVFGAINDIAPRYGQDCLTDPKKGRKLNSVRRVPGAGHLIVQQQPDALATFISDILISLSSSSRL